MTRAELIEDNQELRAMLQAIYDQIAVVLDIEDAEDLEVVEGDE